MKVFKIVHETQYSFTAPVQLYPHTLRLRPREGHELRIQTSTLDIFPSATLRWYRDVEENSIAIATFNSKSKNLNIKSEITIQKFDLNPHDFLIAEYAVAYPFSYEDEDNISLSPYLVDKSQASMEVNRWAEAIWKPGEEIQTFLLLNRLNQYIFNNFKYIKREEEGVQSAEFTIGNGSGSCRDFANLFIVVARHFGLAARFVSGYVFSNSSSTLSGSTHAWVEVFIPGAGWKGFDPTFGTIVGAEHVATAVARSPELVPPVSGSFFGSPGSTMKVDVWVSEVI